MIKGTTWGRKINASRGVLFIGVRVPLQSPWNCLLTYFQFHTAFNEFSSITSGETKVTGREVLMNLWKFMNLGKLPTWYFLASHNTKLMQKLLDTPSGVLWDLFPQLLKYILLCMKRRLHPLNRFELVERLAEHLRAMTCVRTLIVVPKVILWFDYITIAVHCNHFGRSFWFTNRPYLWNK